MKVVRTKMKSLMSTLTQKNSWEVVKEGFSCMMA